MYNSNNYSLSLEVRTEKEEHIATAYSGHVRKDSMSSRKIYIMQASDGPTDYGSLQDEALSLKTY